jgi:hypothetical protein
LTSLLSFGRFFAVIFKLEGVILSSYVSLARCGSIANDLPGVVGVVLPW